MLEAYFDGFCMFRCAGCGSWNVQGHLHSLQPRSVRWPTCLLVGDAEILMGLVTVFSERMKRSWSGLGSWQWSWGHHGPFWLRIHHRMTLPVPGFTSEHHRRERTWLWSPTILSSTSGKWQRTSSFEAGREEYTQQWRRGTWHHLWPTVGARKMLELSPPSQKKGWFNPKEICQDKRSFM